MTKLCTHKECRTEKPLKAFGNSRSKKDGLQSMCKECVSKYGKLYRKTNAAKVKEYAIRYRKENKAKNTASIYAWRRNNAEVWSTYTKAWRKANRAHLTHLENLHRAAKKERTPKWLTSDQLAQIELFYEAAHALTKELNIEMHVDHIVPLRGKDVSGLHVPWNLQVITAEENHKKHNKFDGLCA
jgi:5-methylcytosine-specific restriction endonuclease McrA